jgi:hypothetical protein
MYLVQKRVPEVTSMENDYKMENGTNMNEQSPVLL